MIRCLLRARLHMLGNAYRAQHRGGTRVAVLGTLGLGFALAIFATSFWFFGKCLTFEPIGEVVIRRVLGMALLTIFSLLSFSTLVGAFSSFYLSEDLQYLVSKPIPPSTLYTMRYLETGAEASWMIILFGSPVFISAGLLFDAGPSYYLSLALVLLALTVIPTSLGVGLSLLLTSVLSARRARLLFVFAGTAALSVLLLLLRRLRPEQFMNPDLQAPLLEALQALKGTDPAWMPSTWACDALWQHLGYGAAADLHPHLLLLLTSAASFFVVAWVFRALYPRAFSRSQDGLQLSSGHGENASAPRTDLDQLVHRAASSKRRLGFAPAMLAKDRRIFVRDTAQWSQLLILVAIAAIYVLNFKYISVVTGVGLISDLGLHFLNLGLAGFVVMALAVRFVYPAVSLEGPAFWLIRSSPNTLLDFLRAKAHNWFVPLATFGCLLLLLTHSFLGTAPTLSVVSVLTALPFTYGLVTLGIGLGARYPRFDTDNAAKIATGLGGVLFMITASALLVVSVLCSIAPTVVLVKLFVRGVVPDSRLVVLALATGAAVVLVPMVTGRMVLRSGARCLEEAG